MRMNQGNLKSDIGRTSWEQSSPQHSRNSSTFLTWDRQPMIQSAINSIRHVITWPQGILSTLPNMPNSRSDCTMKSPLGRSRAPTFRDPVTQWNRSQRWKFNDKTTSWVNYQIKIKSNQNWYLTCPFLRKHRFSGKRAGMINFAPSSPYWKAMSLWKNRRYVRGWRRGTGRFKGKIRSWPHRIFHTKIFDEKKHEKSHPWYPHWEQCSEDFTEIISRYL